MATVKADGTILYGDGRTGHLSPKEMDHRDRYNEWLRLPADKRAKTPPPPLNHDNRAGLMQRYIDPETEKDIAARLKSGSKGNGSGGLLDGLRR